MCIYFLRRNSPFKSVHHWEGSTIKMRLLIEVSLYSVLFARDVVSDQNFYSPLTTFPMDSYGLFLSDILHILLCIASISLTKLKFN